MEETMQTRSRSSIATVLALLLSAGTYACSDSGDDGGGAGGSTNRGGSTGTGGRGSGGSTGTGGSVSTGGSTGAGGSVSSGGSTGAGGSAAGGSGAGGSSGAGGAGRGGSGGAGDARPADTGGGTEGGAAPGEFVLKVTDVDMRNGKLYFKRGQTRGTGQMSPGFEWGAHPEAKSYALSMYDRSNNNNTHWVMYDIPATVTKLPPNLAHMMMSPEVPGARHTSFAGGIGYFGPGAGSCNNYVFEVHAMKVDKLAMTGANNALRNMVLPANRVAKTPEVVVIGNTSAGMCP